jgi:hypothetical protein
MSLEKRWALRRFGGVGRVSIEVRVLSFQARWLVGQHVLAGYYLRSTELLWARSSRVTNTALQERSLAGTVAASGEAR